MRAIVFLIGLSFGFFYTNPGQAQTDSLKNQPNVKINVNVQRDENGNVIGYDSSYVETWSSDGRDIDADSLMQSFNQRFENFDDFGDFDFRAHKFSDNSFFPDSITNDPFKGFFSFPDMEKIQQEIMNEMRQMQKMFGDMPIEPPQLQNDKKVKKEKISFQPTKI